MAHLLGSNICLTTKILLPRGNADATLSKACFLRDPRKLNRISLPCLPDNPYEQVINVYGLLIIC